MGQTSETRIYTSMFSTTLDDHRPELVDQVHNAIPFIWFMKNQGRSRDRGAGRGIRMYTGGARVKFPIIISKNPNTKSYSKFENLTVNASEEMTIGIEDMKNLSTAVGISGEEMDQNRGLAEKRDLLRDKLDIAEIGLKEEFEKQLVQGTAVAATSYLIAGNSTKDINPIGFLVQKETTASVTVHNINQSTETSWRNQVKDGSGLTAGVHLPFIQQMNNLYHTCARGSSGDAPDFGISDQNYYEYYETAMMNLQRFIERNEAATSMGFDNVKFKSMTMFWSEYVPNLGNAAGDAATLTQSDNDAVCYFLNSRWLNLVISDKVNFVNTPFVEPYDQDAIWSKILVRAQLITTQRRKLGVHYGVDTSV